MTKPENFTQKKNQTYILVLDKSFIYIWSQYNFRSLYKSYGLKAMVCDDKELMQQIKYYKRISQMQCESL